MSIAKQEAALKSAFGKELKKQLPGFLSLRLLGAGDPDRAIVGLGKVTFLEFKHGTPRFDSPGNQEVQCMRLDQACFCRYIIWQESSEGADKRTLIVRPTHVHHRRNGGDLIPEESFPGFDHVSVVEWLRKRHAQQLR